MEIIRREKNPEQNETRVVKIHSRIVDNTAKGGQKFTAYKVEVDGKLVDCRFRRDVDTRALEAIKLMECEVGYYSDASERYAYPRVYIGDVRTVTVLDEF